MCGKLALLCQSARWEPKFRKKREKARAYETSADFDKYRPKTYFLKAPAFLRVKSRDISRIWGQKNMKKKLWTSCFFSSS
jgi:hypothetical protein